MQKEGIFKAQRKEVFKSMQKEGISKAQRGRGI